MTPTMVQLPSDLIERLDRRAARETVSRSQVIREAIRAYLAADEQGDLAALYAAAYTSFPLDAADEWGDLASWHEAAVRSRDPGP